MSIFSFLILLLIAAACGAVGQAFAGYTLPGFLVSAGVGFVGAIIGIWNAGALGLKTYLVIDVGGVDFPVLWSMIGSALLVGILAVVRTRPAR